MQNTSVKNRYVKFINVYALFCTKYLASLRFV